MPNTKTAKNRINSYWTRRKKTPHIPLQASREEELQAIAAHISSYGTTICAPNELAPPNNIQPDTRVSPMPGWR